MIKINHIYIIDDDPITVFGIRKVISSVVHCDIISTHANGKLAIDGIKSILKENQKLPEIIFLDLNMPIMDGWQFLEEFIALPIINKIQVNIVTSSIDGIDKRKWEQYNSKTHHIVTFNHKPIRKKEIIEITKVA